jgi:hypothetical protein
LERGEKMEWLGEVSFPVLTARRWVEVARPPSDVEWVISWEILVCGRDALDRVLGRGTAGTGIEGWIRVKLEISPLVVI